MLVWTSPDTAMTSTPTAGLWTSGIRPDVYACLRPDEHTKGLQRQIGPAIGVRSHRKFHLSSRKGRHFYTFTPEPIGNNMDIPFVFDVKISEKFETLSTPDGQLAVHERIQLPVGRRKHLEFFIQSKVTGSCQFGDGVKVRMLILSPYPDTAYCQ